MSRAELGLKRACQGCGSRFYDLMKSPIACPKCGTIFEIFSATPALTDDEELEVGLKGAEFVSLEDAEVEAVTKDLPADDDIDLGDDDSTFLEEDEDENDDVSGLIETGLEEDEES
jgi:uncharacterized protein (TIGR02300 family)